ncbi:iron complex transport system substrate-binding protein [Gracilibacillus orientalis]|uniref:Iron complex transport system substrate-binding protein n=1 Tax=Gracilibacillus orientalis TaxID=334253 RepID=A0A1I4P1X2_9BACI|nr:iron-siderophore ABC transporter substrate-binding protein [Gracilibacillus orientalis]SFM21665.1 iron complex transport system substrate-binding protein [Gracilibacillus orientalis]
MKKSLLLLFIGLFVSVFAVACGTDDSETTEKEQNQEETNTEDESAEENSSITVSDIYGEQTFEEVPERIVVLEWVYAEDLLALGVQPVGMADIEGYQSWVNIEPELGENVEDVGTRQEPNLEAIHALNPDVIITSNSRHEAILDSLKDIAPTLAYNSYPEEGEGTQYEEMEATFKEMGKLVQKEEQADEILADLDQTYQDTEAEIANAGIENTDFVLSQAFSSENTPVIRLFKDNAMATEIMTNIGLDNAYQSEEFQLYGFDETSVESLQTAQDAHFFYIVQEDDNVFSDQLAGNPAWEELAFVKEDRTYRLPGDTWTFGGPLSAEVFANQIKEAILQEK